MSKMSEVKDLICPNGVGNSFALERDTTNINVCALMIFIFFSNIYGATHLHLCTLGNG